MSAYQFTMIGDIRIWGYEDMRKDFIDYLTNGGEKVYSVDWISPEIVNKNYAYIMTMRRPKVLFALHMPPPVHGASMVGKYIKDSKVVEEAFDCRFENIATAANLEDIGKLSFRKLTDVWGLVKRLRRAVKEHRPELVYYTPNATGMPFYKDFLVVESLKRMGCKVVVHYHNKGVATRQGRFLDNMLYKRFFKGLKVVLLADALYKDIEKYVDRENVQVCGNGVPDVSRAISRSVPQNATYPLNVLYLSNMMEEKGVYELLEACARLNAMRKCLVCRFVGGWKDITEEAFRDKALALGLTVSTPSSPDVNAMVQALGPKYGDEKVDCLKKANLFVFPTYYHNECFPLVLLEAMQCQLACISTREAAIPEIIDDGKTGFVIDKTADGKPSVEALTDAISTLIDDRMLCYNMGQEGRKKYEQEYTLDVFEKRIAGCLMNLL